MRANAKQLALYFRQFDAMLRAGIRLSFALAELSRDAPGAALKRASGEMERFIEAGGSWSAAMRPHPGLFSPEMIAMIEAGESSGEIAVACAILADGAEREYQIHQLIKRETWYPKLLLFLSTVLMPLPIRVGPVEISGEVQALILGLGWGGWKIANYLWPLGSRGGEGRLRIDRWRSKLPLVGKVVRGFAIARFCRVLGGSYAAGIDLPRGVRLGAAACGNAAIAAPMQSAGAKLQGGTSLTQALDATGAMPPLAMSLLRSGEVSGELNPQLQAAAHFIEGDAQTALQQGVQAFNLLVFLGVALKIGTQVIQYWMRYGGL